jgi:hypothetical protein
MSVGSYLLPYVRWIPSAIHDMSVGSHLPGPSHHLCTGFLLADSINHGISLERDDCQCLQYLYYLAQIGLATCPLSNDSLFMPLARSPIGRFFERGLLVALGTDDPLQVSAHTYKHRPAFCLTHPPFLYLPFFFSPPPVSHHGLTLSRGVFYSPPCVAPVKRRRM